MRRSMVPFALLVLTCLTRPLTADSPPRSNLRSDILYTHRGGFVQVSPMHALTLNARVEQFAYDPLGLEIAIVGSESQGDQTVHYIKTVDARTGHEMSRTAVTAPTDDQNTGLLLLGWSVSGKYLLILRMTSDPQDPNTSSVEYLRWDLTSSPPTTREIVPEMPLPPEALRPEGTADGFASPDNHWIAFRQTYRTPDADGKPSPSQSAYLLYDVEKDTFRPLTLPPGANSYSWSDSHDLAFRDGKVRKQFDVVTGRVTVAAAPRTLPP